MEPARIMSELAELGSIDALLARHDSLTPEAVASALRHASDLLAADAQPRFEVSPLYRAYNGFMLGTFLAGSMVFSVRGEHDRRNLAANRLLEFLLEFTHEFGQPLALDAKAEDLEGAIDATVRELDHDLASYYQLGLATFRYVVLGTGADEALEAQRLLGELGYPPMMFQSILDEPLRASASTTHEPTPPTPMSTTAAPAAAIQRIGRNNVAVCGVGLYAGVVDVDAARRGAGGRTGAGGGAAAGAGGTGTGACVPVVPGAGSGAVWRGAAGTVC